MTNNTVSAKFRPSLSSAQIQYLLTVLQTSKPCNEREDIVKQLHKFHLKAVHGIVSPSHVSTSRASLTTMLGFEEPEHGAEAIDWLLDIHAKTPNILSKAQLTRVQHHRYVNDMMTPEEEATYEASN